MERNKFLERREIEELTKTVILAFKLRPDDILVSTEEREVEIRETFYSDSRRRTSQVVVFKTSDSPEEVLFEVAVANALLGGTRNACLMPGLRQLIFSASLWEDPRKLWRIIVDSDLIVVEFRRPIDGWEALYVALDLTLGCRVKGIDHDDTSHCMWFAVFYEHPQ
jgi:hypothetical protein